MNVTSPEMAEVKPLGTDQPQAPGDSLRAKIESTNIAETLDAETLLKISQQCKTGFDADIESRRDWETALGEWTKLALQVREEKTWPWVGASNVKYPLLSTAALQFNARAYPSLVPATSDVVKVEVIGKDPDGVKLEKATRIGIYMSYQLLNQMEGWEEDMDKLLVMLPIVGTMFKKTWYNPVTKQNVSELVLPKSLVVNYWAKSLECSERVSQIIEMTKRRIKEKQMSGVFLEDVDLGDPVQEIEQGKPVPAMDETTPYQMVEMHTYYDLDDDGYSEPYIVTFERFSGKVVRVVARFDEKGMYLDSKGKLEKIDAIQYFTKFSFIPNPDGGFYDIGFGLLLSPINEAVNTLINQQIDAGTLSNLQGGFLGKGLKIKMGESRWTPGEWKTVNSTADDLRKQIVPLPVKDPSTVLFQLMGTLITSGKELASIAEIFTGKMPGQNTPATTTMATVEQGMKVFTAVYKRVFRSLKCEFKKIFDLNGVYLDPQQYQKVVSMPVQADDFDPDDYDVCPGADPNTATQTEKLMKAQGLMEMMAQFPGVLDPIKVATRILAAQEVPAFEELFSETVKQTGQMPPPAPDPKVLQLQAKSQMDQQKVQLDAQKQQFDSQLDQRDQQFKQAMEAQKQQSDLQHEELMTQVKAASEYHMTQARIAGELAKTHATLKQDAATHGQKIVQDRQTHQQSMQHNEEKLRLAKQQAKSSNSGKPKK